MNKKKKQKEKEEAEKEKEEEKTWRKYFVKQKKTFFFHQNRGNYFLKDSMLEATFQDCLEHHLIPMGLIGGKKNQVDR